MSFPTNYIVFDTETNLPDGEDRWTQDVLRLRLGVALQNDESKRGQQMTCMFRFNKAEDFHEFVMSKSKGYKKTWVFAHNIGFDLRIVDFWGFVSKGFYSLTRLENKKGEMVRSEPFVVMDDPPTIIKTYLDDGREIMWCDTFQWISHSLKKIGESLGFEKSEMPEPTDDDAEWYDYCQRDVEVLDAALRKVWYWLKANKVKHFAPTRAAQSMNIFTSVYGGSCIKRHDIEPANQLERLAYYGGHTDLFHRGKVEGPIVQYDVNSLYPYVMSANWFPYSLSGYRPDSVDSTSKVEPNPRSCSAEVLLNTSKRAYPVRCKSGTLFCVGRVRTVLAGPELASAFESGDVVKTLRFNRYQMNYMFKNMVDDYYKMRLEAKSKGDDVSQMIIKLLLNSLYGKFGQQTPLWVDTGERLDPSVYSQGLVTDGDVEKDGVFRVLAGHVYETRERVEARNSFVAIASFTTAYAREYMRLLRSIVGSGHYYYQATDSLYVDLEGEKRLKEWGKVDDVKLGGLKREGEYQWVNFKNIHNLDKDNLRVRGSVRAKAEEITREEYELRRFGKSAKRSNTETINNEYYSVDVWESFPVATFNGNHDRVIIRKMAKSITGEYKRQQVLSTGRCLPFVIDNWEVPPESQSRLPLNIVP